MKNKFIIICLITTLLLCGTTGCSPLTYPLMDAALSSDAETSSKEDSSDQDKDADEQESETSADGDSLLLEGIEAYNDGDYADAIDKLLAAESAGLKKQNLSTLYSYMGASCEELALYNQAIEYYQKALDEDPEDPQNYVNLAIGYRLSGDYEMALETYKDGLDVDPDYPELNSSLGTLYLLLDDAETAIPYFEKALEEDPSLAVTYGNAALAYAMTGDFETAEEYLDTARSKGYTNADVIQERIDALK
ncbi:MAG: tetratricopeptide repeat protein [Lachnospiraceae bacterium]|nr:tetratricopeptide repeat protein [Lachnospiraceae bacterium]